MRCFGPSASRRAKLRRDELEEAFGEGYDEAEEARIFAVEELARQQSELEEAFGEGYDPEEEARLFAEDDASPRAASPREAPGEMDFPVRGNGETRRESREENANAREGARDAPPATIAASPRARPRALPQANDRMGVTTMTLESPSSSPEEPPKETKAEAAEKKPRRPRRRAAEETQKPAPAPTANVSRVARVAAADFEAPDASPAPKRAVAGVAGVAGVDASNAKADASSSLPPLDLGDPERYRRLRETLGVEDALRAPLRRLLAPLEATARDDARGGEKVNPDLFVPLDMPRGLLLPFAQHEAYGRLKLREIRQEDGSAGYGTLAARGAGAARR